MSAKHTPGPWAHRNGRIFQLDRQELTIANVARAFDGDYSPTNGDLLAAAPDLLEALEEVFVIGDRLVSDVYGREFVEKARAAIAKATGE